MAFFLALAAALISLWGNGPEAVAIFVLALAVMLRG